MCLRRPSATWTDWAILRMLGSSEELPAPSVSGELIDEMEMEEPTENCEGDVATIIAFM